MPTSWRDSRTASPIARIFARRLACVSTTPLGSPVDPDVYCSSAVSEGPYDDAPFIRQALHPLPEFGGNLRHDTSHERRYMHLFVRVRLHRTGNANVNADGLLDDLAKFEL